MDFAVGFMSDPDIDKLGTRSGHPIKTIYIMFVFQRCLWVISNILMLIQGQMIEKGKQTCMSSRTKKLMMVIHCLLDIAIVIYVCIIYRNNDYLNNQNKPAKIWIKAEIIS